MKQTETIDDEDGCLLLKPCPFCGGSAIIQHDWGVFGCHIACRVCGARSLFFCGETCEMQAEKVWNKRV